MVIAKSFAGATSSTFLLLPMNPQQTIKLNKLFIRPASIEIRCNNLGQYVATKEFYIKVFGNPTNNDDSVPICSFRIGAGVDGKDTELLLTQKNSTAIENHAIFYWEADGMANPDLKPVHEAVIGALGAKEVEAPFSDNRLKLGKGTQRSVIQDGSGNLVGLVINPSYPIYKRAERNNSSAITSALQETGHTGTLVGGILLALVVGFFVGKFTGKSN